MSRSPISQNLTDAAIRLIGLALVALVWRAGGALRHMAAADQAGTVSNGEMLLAALVFLGMSSGLALLVLGGHVLDRITVSKRWWRND